MVIEGIKGVFMIRQLQIVIVIVICCFLIITIVLLIKKHYKVLAIYYLILSIFLIMNFILIKSYDQSIVDIRCGPVYSSHGHGEYEITGDYTIEEETQWSEGRYFGWTFKPIAAGHSFLYITELVEIGGKDVICGKDVYEIFVDTKLHVSYKKATVDKIVSYYYQWDVFDYDADNDLIWNSPGKYFMILSDEILEYLNNTDDIYEIHLLIEESVNYLAYCETNIREDMQDAYKYGLILYPEHCDFVAVSQGEKYVSSDINEIMEKINNADLYLR